MSQKRRTNRVKRSDGNKKRGKTRIKSGEFKSRKSRGRKSRGKKARSGKAESRRSSSNRRKSKAKARIESGGRGKSSVNCLLVSFIFVFYVF